MRSLSVSVVLVLLLTDSAATAQTPSPGSSTASSQATTTPGQAQTTNVTPPTISAGPPYRLDLSGDANITGTYRVNGVPISATSNWTQSGNNISYTAGNVGIGTPTPAHALEVNGVTSFGAPGGVYGFSIGGPSPGPYPTLGFNAFYNGTGYLAGVGGYGGVFQFQDGDGLFGYYGTSASVAAGAPHTFSPRFTINKDGNVGIGSTPTANRLRVIADTSISTVFASNTVGTGVAGTSDSGYGVYAASNSGHGLWGNSNSGYGVYGSSSTNYAGYFVGNVYTTGFICATNVSCASDARLKQEVTPLSYGLPEVLRLRPVRWQWKDTTTTQLNLGLVAQDVEPVLPELILRNVDTKGSLGLNYFGFVPVLINAIQEQQDTITALKAENSSLDARIRALEQALQRLREPR